MALQPTARLIRCPEQGRVGVPLSEVLAPSGGLGLHPDVEGKGYFDVHLASGGELWLRARNHVGFIPLTDDLVVNVVPRVPIDNLDRIVELAGGQPRTLTLTRHYAAVGGLTDVVRDLFAESLARHLTTLSARGLLREYRRREASSPFPRGRIEVGNTLRKHHARGVTHIAAHSWFERTADTAPNRCLKYAAWLLGRHYAARPPLTKRSMAVRRQLNALYSILDAVHLDHRHDFLADRTVLGLEPLPTLRDYYADALAVARAVLDSHGISLNTPIGEVPLPSLILDMGELFEAYVRRALQVYAAANGWSEDVLDGNTVGRIRLFTNPMTETALGDECTVIVPPPTADATPDIVIRRADGAVPAVLEVKYIPLKQQLSERDAVNQAVTYAVRYGSNSTVLVHPCKAGQQSGLYYVGSVGLILVYQYRFNLSAVELASEDAKFGRAIQSTLLGDDPSSTSEV